MAQTTTVTKAAPAQSQSPYQLDKEQTLKASRALLAHIENEKRNKDSKAEKRNLLASTEGSSDEEGIELSDVPIWLVLTTKRHIIDKKRLKPGKISIPHSLNTSRTSTICLITADPQRSFKNAVANPLFPAHLRTRITRVIAISKLRSKYKPYESKRQLFSEHDIFLADDRIVALLPNILGKAFYKSGTKRPVTVNIAAEDERKSKEKEKKMKSRKDTEVSDHSVASPERLANEITRTLSTALVHLSPSTCTSIRVGKASWDAIKVAENIDAAVAGLTTKFVPKGWRGVRAIHIKGPETAALPLWLADELWLDESDILEDVPVGDEVKAIEGSREKTEGTSKKRKAPESEEGTKAQKKLKGAKKGNEGELPDDLGKEIALRKEKLKKQKAEAKEEAEEAVVTKKAMRAKAADDGKARAKTKKSK
ncbi:hypothetical protein FGG08_004628 [Glutinoglossum americanum]|uniref:Ribosomal protein L1 n=1 Tax=Glutinoglossum americanum TaxID=1670608 RepID=A0A9P8I055_9PEZI|nr:hypothetical protein FGG08_004628 [Glutinoglossum americanum]